MEWRRHERLGLTHRRTSPGGTGYVWHLYSIPELGGQQAAIERHFFGMVDTRAHDALNKLAGTGGPLTGVLRTAWSTFLLSFQIRNPESIAKLRRAIMASWDRHSPKLQADYEAEVKRPGDPDDVNAYLDSLDPTRRHVFLADTLVRLMTRQPIGQFLNDMKWSVIRIPASAPRLLASDRPLVHSNGLAQTSGHIAIPLRPDRLFVACFTEDGVARLRSISPRQLAIDSNRLVVQRARRYVFSKDLRSRGLIERNFGNDPQPSLGESVADGVLADLGLEN